MAGGGSTRRKRRDLWHKSRGVGFGGERQRPATAAGTGTAFSSSSGLWSIVPGQEARGHPHHHPTRLHTTTLHGSTPHMEKLRLGEAERRAVFIYLEIRGPGWSPILLDSKSICSHCAAMWQRSCAIRAPPDLHPQAPNLDPPIVGLTRRRWQQLH